MHKETYSDAAVVAYHRKNFVAIEINIDRYNKSVDAWRVKTVPATYVVYPDGTILSTMLDEYDAKAYLQKLDKALEKARQLEKMIKKEDWAALADYYTANKNPRRAADCHQAMADALKKKEKLSDEDKKRAIELIVKAADARIDLGAKVEDIEAAASDLDSLGVDDKALYYSGVADYLRGDPEMLFEKMRQLRERHPGSDKDDAAMMWINYVLVNVRKDAAAARKNCEEFFEKHPQSKYAPTIKAATQSLDK